MKRVCVIGAGFGGLALAIRAQAAGFATTLVEARENPGGCAHAVSRDGFTFDTGPGALIDRAGLEELWTLAGEGADSTGQGMARDVTLAPVTPFCRLHWSDGTSFDLSGDEAQLRGEVARLAPGDLAGYEDFARYCVEAHAEARVRLGQGPSLDLTSMLRAAPALLRHQAWRTLYGKVASQVRSEKLREALSFRSLMLGGNPQSVSALSATLYHMEKDGGVWWPMGGMRALASGMAALFGPRYLSLLDDIFEHGVLPRDMIIHLAHPSVTDPSLAPPGKSVFSAVVPVANLGKLPIDWAVVGPLMEQRVLDEVGMRFIPDIHDRVVTRFHRTPRDFAEELSAYRGSAWSLEPTRWQSAWARAHNRDDAIPNLYLVGAGTQPGAGIASVVVGARQTARLICADLQAPSM